MLPLFLLLLLASCDASAGTSDSPFRHADVRGTVGEAGTLHLLHDALYIHPLNNDIAGRTDKHLTHSTKIGVTGHFADGDGYDLRLGWRFITPEYKNLGDKLQKTPQSIGRYGDWAELQFARAMGFDLGDSLFRVQFTVGLGHLGPKGAKEVQVGLHKKLDNAWSHLVWIEEEQGFVGSTNISLGWSPARVLLGVGVLDSMFAGEFNNTLVMSEAALVSSHVLTFDESLKFGFEAKIVRQYVSVLYQDRIKPYRFEASFGALLSHWYKPTVNFVSDYIEGDGIPQFYFDFLNVNIPL